MLLLLEMGLGGGGCDYRGCTGCYDVLVFIVVAVVVLDDVVVVVAVAVAAARGVLFGGSSGRGSVGPTGGGSCPNTCRVRFGASSSCVPLGDPCLPGVARWPGAPRNSYCLLLFVSLVLLLILVRLL